MASVLGVRVVLGRWFTPEEHQAGNDAVAVLTHEGWLREFGGDSTIVGRTILLDNTPLRVVGLLQPLSLGFPKPALTFWAPLAPPTSGPSQWRSGRESPWLTAVARLRRNATIDEANAQLAAIGRQLAGEYPVVNRTKSFRAEPLQESIVGRVRPMLWLLAAAVASVLLVAYANVATLLRANAESRRPEFAIRTALGGTRGRVTRQVLAETSALSVLGGLLGIAVAPLVVAVFLHLYPDPLPTRAQIAFDARVIAASIGMIALAALVAGILAVPPARASAATDGLRDGVRTVGTLRERRRGDALIMTQIALSVLLLFAGGILVRSFWNLSRVTLGFEPRGLLSFWLTPMPKANRPVEPLVRELTTTIRSWPGVREVASSYDIPTAGRSFGSNFLREGKGDVAGTAPAAGVQMVSSRFFTTMGIPLRTGRDISDADRADAPFVVVVNESFVNRYFPGESVLGKRIAIWDTLHTIVGVVGDVRRGRPLWDPPEPEMYFSIAQRGQSWRYIVIRTEPGAGTEALIRALRTEVHRLDPSLPLAELAMLDDRLGDVMAPQRFRGALVGTLAALALALSITGIYGVVTYRVGRRTREIGIRLALGEEERAILLRVVRRALLPATGGVAIGILVSLAAGGLLESFVLGVTARDAPTLFGVATLFVLVAITAAYVPARRASRIDPTSALRAE
jgi:predicted permease